MRSGGGKLQIGFGPNHYSVDDQTGRILNGFGFGLLQVSNSDYCKL